MVDQATLARVNLNAVLRAVEELPLLDVASRRIAEGKPETVQFIVGGIGKARLAIGDGKIRFLSGGGHSSIVLWFPKPENFNAMFAGKGGPIPLKGFTKIGWLKDEFTSLTERLAYYLKPDAKLLAGKNYRTANSVLSLHVAAYAISEVGNHDADGRLNAARMSDGGLLVAAKGGPELTVEVKGKTLRTMKGATEMVRARMIFPGIEEAGAMLRGELNPYEAIGTGKISLSGFTPLIDHVNKVLGLVPRYLG